MQTKVQAVLAEAVRSSRAAWATGIVMDPRTGAVIAMATAPGYDNNQAHLQRNAGLWSNQALQTVYEPGSTFKVVTFSAALTAGVVWPGEVLHNVPDFLNFGDKVIHDDTTHKPWNISVRRILKISSNIGTDEIAQMVGRQDLMRWIHRYGFGQQTALALPGRIAGARAPRPRMDRVVDRHDPDRPGHRRHRDADGVDVPGDRQRRRDGRAAHRRSRSRAGGRRGNAQRRVLSPSVDHSSCRCSRASSTTGGTGTAATIPGYTVAGKTGTAQKPTRHGGYSNQYDASFIGFLPAENPQVEIMVVVDSPRRATSAATSRRRRSSRIGCVVRQPRRHQAGPARQLAFAATHEALDADRGRRAACGARARGGRHHRRHLPGRGRPARRPARVRARVRRRRARLRRGRGRQRGRRR